MTAGVGTTGGAPGAPSNGAGRAVLLAARDGLESVLFALVEIHRVFDREDLRVRLMRGIHDVYVALDTSELALAHLEALHEIVAIATECGAVVRRMASEGEDAVVDRSAARLGALARAVRNHAERVGATQLAQRDALELGALSATLPPQRPFRASVGVPQLHAPPRARVAPHVDVGRNPEAPPREAAPAPTLAVLASMVAAVERGEDPTASAPVAVPVVAPDPGTVFEPAIEEVEAVRRWAIDAVEDVATHRSLRVPNPLESWKDQGKFEQFICDNVDLLAALGSAALPRVLLHHAEAEAPDPERAFAVALVLGSIDGSDTAFAAVSTMKQSPPEEHPGWTEGFRLAPSPHVDVAMIDLLAGERADLVEVAIAVLAERGTLDDRALQAVLGRTEPGVRAVLARVLGWCGSPAVAIPALEALAASPGEDEGLLRIAALESLLARGRDEARTALRRHAGSGPPAERTAALELLAMGGGAADLDRLLRGIAGDPSPDLVRALGRFGHPGSLDALVELLGSTDDGVPLAAAEALERITGAGLFEEVDEPWDITLPPEAQDVPGALPVPNRRVRRVVTSVEAWRSALLPLRRKLATDTRHRAGRPFAPSMIVDELESLVTPLEERMRAARELPLAAQRPLHFDPRDWVVRQEAALAALREDLRGPRAGAWPDGSSGHAPATAAAPRETAAREASAVARGAAGAPREAPVAAREAPAASGGAPAAPTPPEAPAVPSFLKLPAAPPPTERSALGQTMMAPSAFAGVAREVLPFAKKPGAAEGPPTTGGGSSRPPPPAPPVAEDLRRTAAAVDPPTGDALPFGAPRLTLVQYATVCAASRRSASEAAAALARFGLADPRAAAEEDARWQERLRQAPKEREVWERLVATFTTRPPPG